MAANELTPEEIEKHRKHKREYMRRLQSSEERRNAKRDGTGSRLHALAASLKNLGPGPTHAENSASLCPSGDD